MSILRVFLALAMLIPSMVLAGDITITWTLPAEREDGTVLSIAEIDHYELYADGVKFGDLAGGDNETFTSSMTPGEHCFAMKTVDTGGRVSEFSNEVCKTVTSDSAPNTVTIKVEVAP